MKYPDIPWETRWALIKCTIEDLGSNLTALGDKTGNKGLSAAKRQRYPAAQNAIADFLNVSPVCLFPERYGVEWSDDLQAEVEKAIPRLRGDFKPVDPKMIDHNKRLEHYRERPVDLDGLPNSPESRHRWVIRQVHDRGFDLAEIASALGVERKTIHDLKKIPYFLMQQYLADCLGVAPQALWPERYDASGEPISRRAPALLLPGQRVPHRLDLSDGLWLPSEALVGLPGMPTTMKVLQSQLCRKKSGVRKRSGFLEVHFSVLPAETRFFLAGSPQETLDPAEANAKPRQRRRNSNRIIDLHDDEEGRSYYLQIDTRREVVTVSAVSLERTQNKVHNFQQLDMTASELRDAATAMIEAAQALEVTEPQ